MLSAENSEHNVPFPVITRMRTRATDPRTAKARTPKPMPLPEPAGSASARSLAVLALLAGEGRALTLAVGAHVPLHCTASGKLFLAFMPAAQRDALLAHASLAAMTPATLTSAKALRAECERIAAAGHSCDREEFIAGLIAVAVPVRDG